MNTLKSLPFALPCHPPLTARYVLHCILFCGSLGLLGAIMGLLGAY